MGPEIGRIVLVIGIVLVVIGGLAVLGVRLPFGRLPGDIAFNAAPSIEHLAAARAEMRSLEFDLRDLVREVVAGRREDPTRIEDQRARVRSSVEAYLALPVFPGEREVWASVATGSASV